LTYKISLLIVDDHGIVRQGIRAYRFERTVVVGKPIQVAVVQLLEVSWVPDVKLLMDLT